MTKTGARLAAGLGGTLLLGAYGRAAAALPGAAGVRRLGSAVLDMDVGRVTADLTSGRPPLRASVHPLQKLMLAPLGNGLARAGIPGRDPLRTAQLLSATASLLGVLACGLLAGQLTGGARAPALAAGALCGASFSSLLAASLPESAVFAGLGGIAPLLLLGARWDRAPSWAESCLWGALGALAFGLTVSQGLPFGVALGVRLALSPGARGLGLSSRWGRAALALALGGLLVGAGSELQARVYPGAPRLLEVDPIAGERPYLRIQELRDAPAEHLLRLLSHFAVWSSAAPFPVPSDFLIRAGFGYWSLSIEEAPWASAPWPQQLLFAALGAAALGAALLALRCLASDRRFLAPCLCLAWHLLLHAVYGREYVLYAPHWHAVWIGTAVAAVWNRLASRRRALGVAVALLCPALLLNNALVLRAVYAELAYGLSVERRDAEGRPSRLLEVDR